MRLPDWNQRFADFCKAREATPFEWGKNDCCLFAADAVFAMTGVDPAARWRGYTTSRQAQRVIGKGGGMKDLVSQAMGDPVRPSFAAVGDVVLLMNEGRELLGVCNGTNVIGPGPEGTAILSMEAAVVAWKV